MRFSRAALRTALCPVSLCLLLSIPAFAQNWGEPVWSDEFNGPEGAPIDPSKWDYKIGVMHVNNEVEYYCAPTTTTGGCDPSKPNAYLDGRGHLIIQAIRLNSNTTPYSGSWTSARLSTNGLRSFQYGRVESRMSLPVGSGIWPAFWALGSNIGSAGWPKCGEADYMENVPASGGLGPDAIRSTLHADSPAGAYDLGRKFTSSGADVTGMHAYGAIWSPGMIQFYVDDPAKVFFVATASDLENGQEWAFEHPFFLILNLAIGGVKSWPGPSDATTDSPAVMTVDYVRIYKAAPVPAPTFGNPAPIAVKTGAAGGNLISFTVRNAPGTGRVYLSCATDAPAATCQVTTNDPLNRHTADFATDSVVTATVGVSTTPKSKDAAGTPPGTYRATVNVYTVSATGSKPDASLTIPLTVN
jgi:beta-glucanase (GH16 family)